MLVDGYNFEAYKAAGYGNLGWSAAKLVTEKRTIKMPNFTPEQRNDYSTSIGRLNPLFTAPETVLRLGGTIAVQRDEIVFNYSDCVPGDHPDPNEVLASFK